MLEGAQPPCRRELSAAQEPGELLLAQGWNPRKPQNSLLGTPARPCWGQGGQVTLLPSREMPTRGAVNPSSCFWVGRFRNVFLPELLSVHPAFTLDFERCKKCRFCGKSPFLHNSLAKASPALILVTGRARKWIREVTASGEVKGSLRSAVIKMSPFFFLPNQWGSLCGWTQTLFLGSRLYPCGDCGSGCIILRNGSW